MKIIKEWPPNIESIRSAGLNPTETTVFTFGDLLYVPGEDVVVSFNLQAHENVHSERQLEIEGGSEAWWERYLKDESFRLEEEILAYRAQLQYYIERKKDQRKRLWFLSELSQSLSGPLYGEIIDYWGAYNRIKDGILV